MVYISYQNHFHVALHDLLRRGKMASTSGLLPHNIDLAVRFKGSDVDEDGSGEIATPPASVTMIEAAATSQEWTPHSK